MMTVAATTMREKTAMDCIGNGVGNNYNSNSSVGDSDNNNSSSGNSEGGGHIQQSLNVATEETAAALMVMVARIATRQQ